MNKKKNAEALAGFGIHQNLGKFLSSTDSSLKHFHFQCFNCEVWKRGDKLMALGQLEQDGLKVNCFRFCRACWKTYTSVSIELRKDFIENIRRKIKIASEVKIDA